MNNLLCKICLLETVQETERRLKLKIDPNPYCEFGVQLDCGHWLFESQKYPVFRGACTPTLSAPLSQINFKGGNYIWCRRNDNFLYLVVCLKKRCHCENERLRIIRIPTRVPPKKKPVRR